jgi:hypothetical protein
MLGLVTQQRDGAPLTGGRMASGIIFYGDRMRTAPDPPAGPDLARAL